MENNVAIAGLQSEVRALQGSVGEIKSMMTEVLTLSKTLAVVQQQQIQHESNLTRAFKAIEQNMIALNDVRHAVDTRMQEHEAEAAEKEREIRKEVSTLKSEVHAWMNQAKGGARVVTVAWALFGFIIVGIMGWAGSEALKMRDNINRLQGAIAILADESKTHDTGKPGK